MGDAEVLQARMRQSRFDPANRPKKILSQLLKIISLLDEGSMEEIDAAYAQLTQDLAVYEFTMKKIQIVVDTSGREVEAYKSLRDDLQDSMKRTEKDIAELKDRVAHERVVRQNKEEYAVLAKQVETFDSRSKTQTDKEAIEQDLVLLEEQQQKQMAKMEQRKKQMLLLLHLVEDLKKNMDDVDDVVGAGVGDVEMKDE